MSRFMWWAPWEVTRPWLPRFFRGGDEWHNASVAFVVPPLGCFIFFYERGFNRNGEPHLSSIGGPNGYEGQLDEDCAGCRETLDWYAAYTRGAE